MNLRLKANRLLILAACEVIRTSELWRAYERLDHKTRQAARKAYWLFEQNPDHPSLRFKKLAGYDRVWSVRINEQYRAVGERRGATISWAWIGTHNDFDKLFG